MLCGHGFLIGITHSPKVVARWLPPVGEIRRHEGGRMIGQLDQPPPTAQALSQ